MMPKSLNFVLRIFALGLAWQAATVRVVVKDGVAVLEQDEEAQPIPQRERTCPKLNPDRKGKIISLMGTSSAGKSALSSGLQRHDPKHYRKLSIDNMHTYSYGNGKNLPGFQHNDVVNSMNILWDYAQRLANKSPDLNIIMDQVYPMPKDWFCEIDTGNVIPVFLFANKEVLELNVKRREDTEPRHISEPLRHAETYFQWKDVPGKLGDPSYVGNFDGKRYAYLKQAYRRRGIDHVLPPHEKIVVIENVKNDLEFEAASEDLANRLRAAAKEKGYTLSCPQLNPDRKGKIISLMGTSSAGKSALSSGLQRHDPEHYRKLSIDNMHTYSYENGKNLPGFQHNDVVTSMNILWDYAQWLANKSPDLNIIMDQVYPMPEDWFCEIDTGNVIPVFLFANREVLELNVKRREDTEWRPISEPLRHAETYFQWKNVPGKSEDPSYVGNFDGKRYAYLKQAYHRNGIDHVLPPHEKIVVIENVNNDLEFEAASEDLANRLRAAAKEKGYTL